MPKYIEISNELSSNDEENPVGLVWAKKYNAWRISEKSKAVNFAILTDEEFYKFKAGNVKFIFPEYDPEIHSVEESTYSPEQTKYEGHYLTLKIPDFEKSSLPFGCFTFFRNNYQEILLKKITITTDEYIDIDLSPLDLYKDYKEFRLNKNKFDALIPKRRPRKGVLLYGTPGNSKTMEICKLAQHAEEDKFRVFFIQNSVEFEGINQFKEILENEDNVFVIEEITERTRNPEELLSFLDGEMSWNNSYTIATTNYPEQLAWNIVDRPRRFKVIKEFKSPNLKQRTNFLNKIGFPENQTEEAAKLTEGFSFDYLINIAHDAILTGESISKVINEYKEERKKLSKTFKAKIGI